MLVQEGPGGQCSRPDASRLTTAQRASEAPELHQVHCLILLPNLRLEVVTLHPQLLGSADCGIHALHGLQALQLCCSELILLCMHGFMLHCLHAHALWVSYVRPRQEYDGQGGLLVPVVHGWEHRCKEKSWSPALRFSTPALFAICCRSTSDSRVAARLLASRKSSLSCFMFSFKSATKFSSSCRSQTSFTPSPIRAASRGSPRVQGSLAV